MEPPPGSARLRHAGAVAGPASSPAPVSLPLVPALAALPPYVFSELDRRKSLARARGQAFLDLGIGSPDQPTPPAIVAALQAAAADPSLHGYPPFRGHPRFPEAAAR